jgi:hypothetical protein
LRAWIARQGGLTPELRRTIADVLCPDVPVLCATALARWRHDEPDSAELAQRLKRHREVLEPKQLDTLAKLFGDGSLPGPVSPARARRATEQFGLHYYHAIPFDREALEATWQHCRTPDCWPARREARALLGEPVEDGGGPD